MSETKTRSRWVGWLLVLVPVWLVASGALAIVQYFRAEKQQQEEEQARFAQQVSEPLLADDLRKIVNIIGERCASTESGREGLSRMAAMIEGVLGPTNTGYAVKKDRGPAEWPVLSVTIKGTKPDLPPVWVVTSYDSRPGSAGAEANATGLAATLAAAQAMARDHPRSPVHFVFLPHANDPESPRVENALIFKKMAEIAPHAVLCVEAMGAGDALWLSSCETAATPLSQVTGLGAVYGAEVVCLNEDLDLASVLFEMNLPAVRVSTRAQLAADEKDDILPATSKVTASTGRLVTLIRRCAK